MTQTRTQPVPHPKPPALKNERVQRIDPVPPLPEEGAIFGTWGEALTTCFALAVTALGVLAGTVLIGWTLFRVADFLGLLSS